MQRLILGVIAIGFTLLLSGCQIVAKFVIINNSESVLHIKYEVKSSELRPWKTASAMVMTAEQFEKKHGEWQNLPTERVKFSGSLTKVEVILYPKEVLLVAREDVYYIEQEPHQALGITSLTIDGENGLINYEGNQVFDRFEPEGYMWLTNSPTLYTLTYHD